jgi:integrase
MARKGGLTVTAIENLAAKDSRYEVPDPACPGLYLSVHPTGAKSWCYRFRFGGKSRKLTIGGAYTDKGIEVIKIGAARDIADEARVSVARQIDPGEAKKLKQQRAAEEAAASENTLRAVADSFFKHHRHLRSHDHRSDVFKRVIYPALGDRPIADIRRSEITAMLDEIAESRGPAMADYALAALRRVFSWHAARTDDFVSPIIRGMARTSTKERARKRVLSEIEIKALWRASDEAGLFGRYLQFVLLTATRRNEAARALRGEMEGTDWTIPGERYKTKLDHLIPMSAAAVAILGKVPRIGRCAFIFTPDGDGPLSGFGSRKEDFDSIMLRHLRKVAKEPDAQLERWTIHDLRRTARTLLSQAGVLSEHAEACLGHVVPGVEGTYNRYAYRDEKRAAFEKLAKLIERIAA